MTPFLLQYLTPTQLAISSVLAVVAVLLFIRLLLNQFVFPKDDPVSEEEGRAESEHYAQESARNVLIDEALSRLTLQERAAVEWQMGYN